eukprot:COSAG05_NODE_133_length_17087_cov_268.363374_8_plen_248_part_00
MSAPETTSVTHPDGSTITVLTEGGTTTTTVTHVDGTTVQVSSATETGCNDDNTLTGFLPETYVEGFHDPDVVRRMRYRKLGNCKTKDGAQMHVSILSFGASSLGGCFRDDTTVEEGAQVVLTALKSGINLIDVAAWYGHGLAEKVLGVALKDVPRAAYYINTKCCRYQPDILEMFDFSSERTQRSIDESIERMGCGYLDTIQIHDPEYAPKLHGKELSDPSCIIYTETLPAMDACRQAGKVRRGWAV